MRGRLPLFLLLASALTFLASLYLQWWWAEYTGPYTMNAWGTLGTAAALAALGVVAVVGGALLRPSLLAKLPLARCSLLVCYLAVAAATQFGHREPGGHYVYGAYLGIGCSIALVLITMPLRRDEILRRPRVSELVTIGAGAGLLVSLLLPWTREAQPPTVAGDGITLGIESSAGVLAAALAISSWSRSARERVVFAAAAAVLAGAAVPESYIEADIHRAYGTWLGLALAVALAGAAALSARATGWTRPSAWSGVGAAASTILVASLFMPWQIQCYPAFAFPPRGGCVASNGWASEPGSAVGLLALLLVTVYLLRRREVAALTLAIVLFVVTSGLEVHVYYPRYHYGYGSILGFVAAGLLLSLVLGRFRPRLDRARIALRLLAIGSCLAYATVVVVPWWNLLAFIWKDNLDELGDWFSIAAVVLTLELLVAWLSRTAGAASGATRPLTVLPLALLALAGLALVEERAIGFNWGGWLLVGLPLLLALLGWIEERDGLRGLPVPEVLRVDRIPAAES